MSINPSILEFILKGLERLKLNIENTKRTFESLPVYIRYYALSDFKSSTGMDFDGWLNEVNNLMKIVESMKTSISKDYVISLEKFSKNLLKLIDYVKGLKQKVEYLPPGLIPNVNELVEKFSPVAKELEGLKSEIDKLIKLL